MPDVFISYSRKDKPFVRRLHQALETTGREPWVDWANIPYLSNWRQELFLGIESAHAFASVISPDSVFSETCKEELEHAARNNKRIVPIWHRDVDDEAVHEALASHQYLYFREHDDFEQSFRSLMEALDTDLEWDRAHTRLLVRAKEWESEGKDDSFLLRGKDLETAEAMQAEETEKQTSLTLLQKEYIFASRRAATELQRKLLDTVKLGWLGGLAIILSSVLFIVATLIFLSSDKFMESHAWLLVLATTIYVIATPLEVLGVICLYTRRLQALGVLGLIAFPILVSGEVLEAGSIWFRAFGAPSYGPVLPADSPGLLVFGQALSYAVYSLGWALFGVALLRARLFNSLVVKLLISGSLLFGALGTWILFLPRSSTGNVPTENLTDIYSAIIMIFFNVVLALLGFATLFDAGYKGLSWLRNNETLSAISVSFVGTTCIALSFVAVFAELTSKPMDFVGNLLGALLWVGTLVGITALRSRLETTLKKVGWAGLFLVFIGVASLPIVYQLDMFIDEPTANRILAALMLLVLPMGFVLLGIAALKSRVLPRWCGVVLIVTTFITNVLAFVALGTFPESEYAIVIAFFAPWGLCWLVLGYVLWSRRSVAPDRQLQGQANLIDAAN